MLGYVRDAYERLGGDPKSIRGYRGGYLPTERRAMEKQLRAGNIDCVVSTSALELGVDIGSLDVCVLNGYPGSIAATWQRLGRAGRRNRTSLGVLVALSLVRELGPVVSALLFAGRAGTAYPYVSGRSWPWAEQNRPGPVCQGIVGRGNGRIWLTPANAPAASMTATVPDALSSAPLKMESPISLGLPTPTWSK